MSLFTIDQDKCKRDGLCAKECPMQIIDFPNQDMFPSSSEAAEQFCLDCGHCVAICPHGALTLKETPLAEYIPVQKELLPDSQQIRALMLSRRSIRRYKQTPVPHGVLEELIDTARHAPTGSNQQQVYWTVVESPSETRQMASRVIDWSKTVLDYIPDEAMKVRLKRLVDAWDAGQDRILQEAPHVIVAHAPVDHRSGATDCVIALTYLELYAHARELGTCWAGYFTTAVNAYPPLKEALGIPAEHQCFGALMIGYPQVEYKRIPKRREAHVTWRS